MYKTILVTLDATPTDRAIIEHVKELARIMKSRVVLFHVATGVPAQVHGEEAGGKEIKDDKAYLARILAEFEKAGVTAEAELAFGEPVKEIVKWVNTRGCDLVAMSTHGHRLLGDLVMGVTASHVQHQVNVPVLMLRSK